VAELQALLNAKQGYDLEVDGNYITLRTRQRSEAIGVGGADFWNNVLYIGDGARYGYHKVSMTDLSDDPVITPFYQNDGSAISGSTQGIFIDKDYLWVLYNIGGSSNNYLIQYYR
jgi:hypothetical protein